MYRASEGIENEEWLAELETVADRLDLDVEARSAARELFLSSVPAQERSKRPVLAASLYAGSLVAGDRRSQTAVADAADVSRLSIQQRWKDLLEGAGLEPPTW
jgi:transcription initiation factor TFIIIB Brf1 subunit/transcription initiation factor TFIIB